MPCAFMQVTVAVRGWDATVYIFFLSFQKTFVYKYRSDKKNLTSQNRQEIYKIARPEPAGTLYVF